jgi:cell wall assembly regulator SMI1
MAAAVLRLKGGELKPCKPLARGLVMNVPAELLPQIVARSAVSLYALSLTCTTLRTQIALLDTFWHVQCEVFPPRVPLYPFGRWLAEFHAATKVSAAWAALMPYLRPMQRAALRNPAPLEDVLAVEGALGQRFPLDVLFSLSRHFDGQVDSTGSQIASEFYLLPCSDLVAVYRSQLSRGLPKHYLPVARDSAFQKFICVQCGDSGECRRLTCTGGPDGSANIGKGSAAVGKSGHVVVWSPLFEAGVGVSWAAFLRPK